mmetsp:Transcript_27245/g.45057  ORF Transcript_27245/g.45057 Transcript_27245/m.45057 type:complete len:200 (-) Transcript_27245:139-738(-)
MLRRQHPSRRKHGSLATINNRSIESTHSNFSLSETNISAHKSIHRSRPPYHVILHILKAFLLIFRRFKRKRGFEFFHLVFFCRIKRLPRQRFSRCIQCQNILGEFQRSLFYFFPSVSPLISSDFREFRFDYGISSTVATQTIGSIDRYMNYTILVRNLENCRFWIRDWIVILFGPKFHLEFCNFCSTQAISMFLNLPLQ